MDRLGRFGDGTSHGLGASAVAASPPRRTSGRLPWAANGAETGAAVSVASDWARTLGGYRDRLGGEDQGEDDREENPAVGHAGSVHAPTIANPVPGDRHPVVRGRMRRSSGPGPEPGPWSPCGQVETAGHWSGTGQSPVPDATVSASRRVALNSGAHGPWPARTNGDDSIDSKVSGSVTKLRAHSSIAERSRS